MWVFYKKIYKKLLIRICTRRLAQLTVLWSKVVQTGYF